MMTVDEVARQLGIDSSVIRHAIRRGKLEARDATPEEIAELIASGRIRLPEPVRVIDDATFDEYRQKREAFYADLEKKGRRRPGRPKRGTRPEQD